VKVTFKTRVKYNLCSNMSTCVAKELEAITHEQLSSSASVISIYTNYFSAQQRAIKGTGLLLRGSVKYSVVNLKY